MANKKIVDIEYAKALRKRLDSKYATKVELSALKDKLFDIVARTYEEDIATDSYSVPSDFNGHSLIESVPCEVKSISGASKQFNQQLIVPTIQNQTLNGITLTNNGDGSITLSGTATATFDITLMSNLSRNIPLGHKVLLSNFKTPSISTYYIYDAYESNLTNTMLNTPYGYIKSKEGTETTISPRVRIINGATINETIFVMYFDLTLMGLENITSVDEFKAKYPLDYYGFDSGSIKSVSVSKIESWGYNLFDGEIEGGSINATGENISPTTAPNNFRSKNFIEVIQGLTYTLEVNNDLSVSGYYLYEYDANKNFIRQQTKYSNNSQFTLSNNACYIRFHFYKADSGWGTTPPTQEQAQVCFHNASVNLGYKPYVGKLGTITLPNGKIDLNGVNDIKNKLEFVEQENGTYNAIITRRVGVDDLGTLNFSYDSTNNWFSVYFGNINASTDDNKKTNMVCSKYKTVDRNNVVDKSISCSIGKYIIVKDSSYTDVETFKTAMSGIPLYYEKATPTTETIATGLTREQVAMAFEIGGSIINDNENTDYNAQATTTIDFACKDWSI